MKIVYGLSAHLRLIKKTLHPDKSFLKIWVSCALSPLFLILSIPSLSVYNCELKLRPRYEVALNALHTNALHFCSSLKAMLKTETIWNKNFIATRLLRNCINSANKKVFYQQHKERYFWNCLSAINVFLERFVVASDDHHHFSNARLVVIYLIYSTFLKLFWIVWNNKREIWINVIVELLRSAIFRIQQLETPLITSCASLFCLHCHKSKLELKLRKDILKYNFRTRKLIEQTLLKTINEQN